MCVFSAQVVYAALHKDCGITLFCCCIFSSVVYCRTRDEIDTFIIDKQQYHNVKLARAAFDTF